MRRLALLLPLLALAPLVAARAEDPATNAPSASIPPALRVRFVTIPEAAYTNGALRAAFDGVGSAGTDSGGPSFSVLDAETAETVLARLTNEVGGRLSCPRKSSLHRSDLMEFTERKSVLFRTKRTGPFEERFAGTYLYVFPAKAAPPAGPDRRRVTIDLDLQLNHVSPPSPETAPDEDGFCEKPPFFAARMLETSVEVVSGSTTFFLANVAAASLKPSETRPPIVVLDCPSMGHPAPEETAACAKEATANDAGRTVAGLATDRYGLGKTLTEDEVVRLCRAVRTGKRVGRRPNDWYLPPIINETEVFVREQKDIPGAFVRQYLFSTNFRYVQISSGFVPRTNEYDIETMYFQLDEAAQDEIAHICCPFESEEQERAFHFDGTALEYVPDWRERLEPWIETDATIRPYTNAPAADDDAGSCGFGACLPDDIMF